MQKAAGGCPVFSSVWLLVINFVFFLVGILLLGLSSWGITHQDDNVVTQVLPAGSLRTLVAVGVFLLMTSLAGCLGVKFNYNCCGRVTLGIYATCLVILTIMEWAAAGTIISFTNKLDDFGPTQYYKDYAIYALVNQSYADCCCSYLRCPNDTCWLPANLLYPCDSIKTFSQYLDEYIGDRLIPIAVIAILVSFLQLFTAVTACCNQCRGRTLQKMKETPAGPVSYDGMYEGEEGYEGYAYGQYVKNGNNAGGKPAGGAGAPAGGAGGKPAGPPGVRPGGAAGAPAKK